MNTIRNLRQENGHGSVMALIACGAIIVVWFIFTTTMDVIGSSNQKRIRGNLERLNAFEKPQPSQAPQIPRGYQFSY